MTSYWVKTPQWLKRLFPRNVVWDMPAGDEPAVYLTFDDGPHPAATSFVLDQLAAHNAHASFFCVGNNVARYPEIYERILGEGHLAGNHTYDHINGWKTNNTTYLKNIEQAAKLIVAKAFRPPYGRIKLSQIRKLLKVDPQWKIYMWDILSGDFDKNITSQHCLDNVLAHIVPGAIIVFHDSDKAWDRMSFALPLVLQYCKDKGWKMKALPK